MTLAGPIQVEQLARTLAPFSDTIVGSPLATIRGDSPTSTADRARRAVEALGRQAPDAMDGGVDLHETLGEGGMGIVRVGTQRSMGRQVAVKTPRDDRRGEAATVKLLREAWLTGALEHPNIVPVYDVALDGEGAPVIVMRLVDGIDWSGLIADETAVEERFGEDLIEWNLRTFMRVCDAVGYAHSRDIVHRDLKPENVMVGAFGEVYVLDWGIAVTVGDDGDGRFPKASTCDQTVGTPAYMAPEMLAAEAASLGPRTDIYLLGAILFEIIEGRAPHRFESLQGFVDSVVESSPAFEREVPEELERICRRAMAKDPADRYPDVRSLRRAVQDFQLHRGSLRLADDARHQLRDARMLIADAGSDDTRLQGVRGALAACRFGFEAALAQWEDNPVASRGRRDVLVETARFELSLGDHRTAQKLLAELDEPPPELTSKVGHLARADADLRRLGDDHDPRLGQRTRWFVMGVLGTVWCIVPLVLSFFRQPSLIELLPFPLVFGSMCLGALVWARESLLRTAFNRRAVGTVAMSFAGQILLIAGALLADMPSTTVMPMEFFLWAVVSALITVMLDRRFWPAMVGYTLGFLAVMFAHGHSGEGFFVHGMYIMSATHLCLTLTVLVIWRPKTLFRQSPDEFRSG